MQCSHYSAKWCSVSWKWEEKHLGVPDIYPPCRKKIYIYRFAPKFHFCFIKNNISQLAGIKWEYQEPIHFLSLCAHFVLCQRNKIFLDGLRTQVWLPLAVSAEQCAPGSFFDDGSCVPCPNGAYKATFGSEACTPCPTDGRGQEATTQGTGSTSPSNCFFVRHLCVFLFPM